MFAEAGTHIFSFLHVSKHSWGLAVGGGCGGTMSSAELSSRFCWICFNEFYNSHCTHAAFMCFFFKVKHFKHCACNNVFEYVYIFTVNKCVCGWGGEWKLIYNPPTWAVRSIYSWGCKSLSSFHTIFPFEMCECVALGGGCWCMTGFFSQQYCKSDVFMHAGQVM